MKNGRVRNILVTGGAGFIGSNLVERLLAQPDTHVKVFDNLSRRGVLHNVRWLQSLPGSTRLEVIKGDVRDESAVREAANNVSEIYHLAAQVAVTTSLERPSEDFHVNALGTFHVLEAARKSGQHPFLLFTSTNKVYGSLSSVPVAVDGTRYRAKDSAFCGVTEEECLDFHSPYGCSKGAADQYVRDYARIYDIPTVVFRMSCIAGPRQFGNEDQGWVAHFLYSALNRQPITVYGDGFQVRDVLHVHDLIDAMMAAREKMSSIGGRVYNLGGGMSRAVSVVELLRAIEKEVGDPVQLTYKAVRPGDQPLYISDTARFEHDTGWQATRSLSDILSAIHGFWRQNRESMTAREDYTPVSAEMLQEEVA